MPAAAPAATANVGDTSNHTTGSVATPMPRKMAGKIEPPRKPAARLMAYAIALAANEHEHDAGGCLGDQRRDRVLAGEEHILRIRSEPVRGEREPAHRETPAEESGRESGAAGAVGNQPSGEAVDRRDHDRGDHSDSDSDEQVHDPVSRRRAGGEAPQGQARRAPPSCRSRGRSRTPPRRRRSPGAARARTPCRASAPPTRSSSRRPRAGRRTGPRSRRTRRPAPGRGAPCRRAARTTRSRSR